MSGLGQMADTLCSRRIMLRLAKSGSCLKGRRLMAHLVSGRPRRPVMMHDPRLKDSAEMGMLLNLLWIVGDITLYSLSTTEG